MSTTEQHRPDLTPVTTTAEGADEVDRIVAAWNRERPDLDTAPLQIFSRTHACPPLAPNDGQRH